MVLLLARTHYSLLTGPASPAAVCEAAVECGHDHLALVDANALYGLWPFARAAARLGLRAVFGSEVVHRGRRLFALAQDQEGYASLCQLLSERALEPDFDLPRAAARLSAGIFWLCRDLRLLPDLAVRLPRDRLFVAIGPFGHAGPASLASGQPRPESTADGAGEASRKAPDPGPLPPRSALLRAADELDLPLCAVHDVWFPRPEDHAQHLLFLAVKHNRSLRALPSDWPWAAAPWMHLPPRGRIAAGHADVPAAIGNAERLLTACTLAFGEQAAPIFPAFFVPDGNSADSHLWTLAKAGLQRRLGARAASEAEAAPAFARLERELAVIGRMGFSPYFLVVHEIAELARQRGIPCLGRGSAADSLVAYALGLTDADPIRYGLLFERFLNPARRDLPDIDLDFCWRRRDELLALVYERFGQDRVAMLATYNTCGPRAAYLEAAKAAGLPESEAVRRSKRLPFHARHDATLAELAAATPGFAGGGGLTPAREGQILADAAALLAAPRHLGVHPGGIVVTPGPIARHAPLERAQKGVVVTQYDKRFVEALGLVKIDLLGNRALTIADDCVRSLAAMGVAVPARETIDEADPEAARLLQQGRTLGCFQVESPAMRTLLRQLQAPNMDRVIQAVALVRPGPAAAGMKDAFLRRARGSEPVTAAHPLLAEAFADTFGVMLYQEDVIRAAMAVAGMDAEAGDELRRRLCSKDGLGAKAREDFVVAGLRHGLPRAAVERAFAEMARFAGYSFCKAHAVSYGRLAYWCVWLKARWPGAFLCAVLDNDAGYFDKGVYVEEAKRLGVRFLPPCVQTGEDRFRLVAANQIRVGWSQIDGLSQATRAAIAAARRSGGPFADFADFLRRVRPQRDEAEALILVGACDAFGVARRALLWRLAVLLQPRVEQAERRAAAAGALLPESLQPKPLCYPDVEDLGPAERAQQELELLGFALGAHPVDLLWPAGPESARGLVPCGEVAACVGKVVRVRGWLVAWRQHRTKGGEAMAFATLEDGSGLVEATLFAAAFARFGGVFAGRGPYVVRGVVEERLGGVGLRLLDAACDASSPNGSLRPASSP